MLYTFRVDDSWWEPEPPGEKDPSTDVGPRGIRQYQAYRYSLNATEPAVDSALRPGQPARTMVEEQSQVFSY
jgi:hypothetical protein